MRPGRLTYVGRLGDAHRHRHAAVQVMVTTDVPMRMFDTLDASRVCRAVIIPPGAEHEVAGASDGVTVFIDAAGHLGQACIAQVRNTGQPVASVQAWATAAEPLIAMTRPARAPSFQTAEAILGAMTDSDHPEPKAMHPRLGRAVGLLPSMLDGPITLDDVGAAVGLSASRLGHLFGEELGLPFRAFVRWARLQLAMEHARAGGTLTDAAHAAGFSDSAHLNRVCHEMFGLTPSDLAGSVTWL